MHESQHCTSIHNRAMRLQLRYSAGNGSMDSRIPAVAVRVSDWSSITGAAPEVVEELIGKLPCNS